MPVEAAARERASRQSIGSPATESAERVEWLIDNADAHRALVLACRSARAAISISQLALDADCIAYDVALRHGAARASTTTIAHELIVAAQHRDDDASAADAHNTTLVEAVNRSGEAYLTHTRLRGRVVMRVGFGNVLTTEDHLHILWARLLAERGRLTV